MESNPELEAILKGLPAEDAQYVRQVVAQERDHRLNDARRGYRLGVAVNRVKAGTKAKKALGKFAECVKLCGADLARYAEVVAAADWAAIERYVALGGTWHEVVRMKGRLPPPGPEGLADGEVFLRNEPGADPQ